jgi:hypothetical protein
MILTGETRITWREACPSTTLSTPNPTSIEAGPPRFEASDYPNEPWHSLADTVHRVRLSPYTTYTGLSLYNAASARRTG